MAYLEGVAPESASGLVREIYDEDIADLGYIANDTRLFSLRLEVYRVWGALVGAIRAKMDPRRHELATIAAAAALRCSCCVVARGAVLASRFFTPRQVVAIAHEFHEVDLEPVDIALEHQLLTQSVRPSRVRPPAPAYGPPH